MARCGGGGRRSHWPPAPRRCWWWWRRCGLPAGPSGAGDNGDGFRLYCGAGLVPATPDGVSNWKGGVVLGFATGGPGCPDPIASSALSILQLAASGTNPVFALPQLCLVYALFVGFVTALAAGAVAGAGWSRLLVALPALLPLAGLTFSRFFVSTYGEPAGLLGAYAFVLGAGVLAATDRARTGARPVGLALVAGGGLLAATAKLSYLPLLTLGVLVCAATAVGAGWRGRVVGPLVAAAAVLAAVAPVAAGVAWQQRNYAVANTQDLVFTLVLPEIGDAAPAALGLPAQAAAYAGRAYFPEDTNDYPGSEVVAAQPAQIRAAAYQLLSTHPGVVVSAVGTGMTATLGAGLDYLPAAPWTAATVAPVLGTTVGAQGADRRPVARLARRVPGAVAAGRGRAGRGAGGGSDPSPGRAGRPRADPGRWAGGGGRGRPRDRGGRG